MYGTMGIQIIVFYPGKNQAGVVRNKSNTYFQWETYSASRKGNFKLPHYQLFGRQSKLRLDPQYIPNLKWETTVTVSKKFKLLYLN